MRRCRDGVGAEEVAAAAEQAADEAQGVLVQEPVLTAQGNEDLSREKELPTLPGTPNVGLAGSGVPLFFHRVES